MRCGLSNAALPPSSAPTGRRLLPVPGESGAVVQGAGLTRRRGSHARLEGGAGVQFVHHRIPPRRTDAAAWGADRVTPSTGTGGAASRHACASRRGPGTQRCQSYGGKSGWPGRST
jgi:hypothetical protein